MIWLIRMMIIIISFELGLIVGNNELDGLRSQVDDQENNIVKFRQCFSHKPVGGSR